MKIVFLNPEGTLVDMVIENAEEVVIDGNNIEWSTGRSRGISVPFYVVHNDFAVNEGETPPADIAQADQKSKFHKMNLYEEIKLLKQQQIDQDLSLVTLFESIMS